MEGLVGVVPHAIAVHLSRPRAVGAQHKRPEFDLNISSVCGCRYDFDLLLGLNVNEHDPAGFEASRKECLDALQKGEALWDCGASSS
jgi:hypothetical protein